MASERWIFFARIIPERIPLRIVPAIKGGAKAENLGVDYEFSIGIADGQVVADLTVTKGETDLLTLRNLIEADIRTLTDIVGYRRGLSFDVDVISAASPDGNETCIFGIAVPVLAERRKLQAPDELPAELLLAVNGDRHAQIVLADFREAMRVPTGTGFFCYRAVEAMMQAMKITPEENDAAAWRRLHANLRVDRSALDYLKGHADYPRHGKPVGISDAERAKVFEIADEIIRRYLEYLVRGKNALPDGDFSIFAI